MLIQGSSVPGLIDGASWHHCRRLEVSNDLDMYSLFGIGLARRTVAIRRFPTRLMSTEMIGLQICWQFSNYLTKQQQKRSISVPSQWRSSVGGGASSRRLAQGLAHHGPEGW